MLHTCICIILVLIDQCFNTTFYSLSLSLSPLQPPVLLNGDHRHPSDDGPLSEDEGVRKKPRTEAALAASSTSDGMTSKDYYFDSYSHFGELSWCGLQNELYMYGENC